MPLPVRAQGEPLLLWEEPLAQSPEILTPMGDDLVVRFDRYALRFGWEGGQARLPLATPFVGEHEGVFRADTADGQRQLALALRPLSVTFSDSAALVNQPLAEPDGLFNRAVLGPLGRTAVLYRQGRLRAEEKAVFLWLDHEGKTLLRYRHDRPAADPLVFLGGEERLAAVLDEDRLLVLDRQGLLRDIAQAEWEKGVEQPQGFLAEGQGMVLLAGGGSHPFAEGWALDARKLFRVNLPQVMNWSYTEGAAWAVGVPPGGGAPVMLDLATGGLSPVTGVGEALHAVGDPTGGQLAVVSGDNRLRVYLVAP